MNFLDIMEDDLDDEVVMIIEGIPRPRKVYIRNSLFDNLDDFNFRKRFRLSRQTVLALLAQIEDQLEFPYDK